jgi:uroporphyrinogen-III synthase
MTGPPPKPLQGKRIVVTRARAQASSLVAGLSDLGAEVIELPTIETVPPDSYEQLDQALQNIAGYRWLIVTSVNTVRVLSERLATLGMAPSVFAPLRKVAIGSSTAKAMREKGIGADLIPEQYVAESLVAALGDQVDGSRILLARATAARDVIPDELRRRGAVVDAVDAYRTVIPGGAVQKMKQVFSDPLRPPDAVTFTSSSTVKNFFTLWHEAGFAGVPERVAAISIGPVTSETLREYQWPPEVEAKTHEVAGVVEALVDKFTLPPVGCSPGDN